MLNDMANSDVKLCLQISFNCHRISDVMRNTKTLMRTRRPPIPVPRVAPPLQFSPFLPLGSYLGLTSHNVLNRHITNASYEASEREPRKIQRRNSQNHLEALLGVMTLLAAGEIVCSRMEVTTARSIALYVC